MFISLNEHMKRDRKDNFCKKVVFKVVKIFITRCNKLSLIMTSTLSILDPNDNLMKKFQRTLHVHLLHVDNKLSEEILDLVSN